MASNNERSTVVRGGARGRFVRTRNPNAAPLVDANGNSVQGAEPSRPRR